MGVIKLVRNSFTENLSRGELLFAKIDVLNNIKKYLGQENLHFEKETAMYGSGMFFYKARTKYLGDDPVGIGRDIELQFKEYPDGKIHFYFIKFNRKIQLRVADLIRPQEHP